LIAASAGIKLYARGAKKLTAVRLIHQNNLSGAKKKESVL
jgi:hypothetical protein